MTDRLERELEDRLIGLAETLIDQHAAGEIVAPQRDESGYWFGGGNMVQAPDGSLVLVGRFRNQGDSRTGLGVGERGLELAIYRSGDGGLSFEKVMSFSKAELTFDSREVLSIEGSAIRFDQRGVELFVSSEKSNIGYPSGLESYQKPGTGVWTIESLRAGSLESLPGAQPRTVLASSDPRHLHVKDPLLYSRGDGALVLLFCTHPFSWTSSNSGFAVRRSGADEFDAPVFQCFPRGTTWDVAMSRITSVVDVPPVGAFHDHRVSLVFYDGGECVRSLEEHSAAVRRPRGYSCEELGGLGYCLDGRLDRIQRLSVLRPSFVSPWGTGCSRYVDVLVTEEAWYASWQQSQPSQSQPLVMNVVAAAEVRKRIG